MYQPHSPPGRGLYLALLLLGALVFWFCYVWLPWDAVPSPFAPPAGLATADAPIDAVVFICMGQWTQTQILATALASLRAVGRWSGPVFVVTDRSDGWPSLRDDYAATIVAVPPQSDKLAIHSYKCKLFELLPTKVQRVLYMDADIVVSRSLADFFRYLDDDLGRYGAQHNLGFFRDSGGHFWGFCHQCDYWHGGVMFATRQSSEECLHRWCEAIASGQFTADQPALDAISEREPVCSGMFPLSSSFLMFMKDYTNVFLRPARTFSHVTAAGRLEDQSWFYRLIIRLKLGLKI